MGKRQKSYCFLRTRPKRRFPHRGLWRRETPAITRRAPLDDRDNRPLFTKEIAAKDRFRGRALRREHLWASGEATGEMRGEASDKKPLQEGRRSSRTRGTRRRLSQTTQFRGPRRAPKVKTPMIGRESARYPSRARETAARFGGARQEPHRARSPSRTWDTQHLGVCAQETALAGPGDEQ